MTTAVPTDGSTSVCDVLVIGAGAGGLAAAVTAASLGLAVIVLACCALRNGYLVRAATIEALAQACDMNSVMGGRYPSRGITLGPAMTFGYIAAHDLAGVALQTSDQSG